jgi:hypothetical protein
MKDVSREMEGMMTVIVPLLKGLLWCQNRAGRVRRFITGEKTHA